jgi:methylenetetrahydrofolate reductase (NADPH)
MTKVADLLAAGRTFSFEFFPPQNDEERARLVKTLADLQRYEPSFVSVTYRGGRSSRDRTRDLVVGMLRTTSLTPMAHLICAAHSRLELAEILVELRRGGVENLMALGGDPPADPNDAGGELEHAIELVELARAIGGFCVGVAAQPGGHPNSPDMASDRDHLAAKLRVADFAVTQMFFQRDEYLGLVDDLAARHVDKPVVPGIMPVTSLTNLRKQEELGAVVPPHMFERMERAGDRDAVRRAGIEMCTELCQQLLDAGAPGLHFYTLNRSLATREIFASLGLAPAAAS